MTRMGKGWAVLAATLLPGCVLPLDGPAYRDIDRSAAVTLAADRHEVAYDYALVDITAPIIDVLEHSGSESLHRTFGTGKGGPPSMQVGVGDVLQVAVFESAAGGMFQPAEAGPKAAAYVTIPSQSVSRNGMISMPYVGPVRAAGRSIPEIERDIEKRLAGKAIEPQVVISVVENNTAQVAIVGDTLNGANKFKLTGAGERVLDIISRAGGLKFPGYELFVTLQRNDRRATVHFPRLVNDAHENIYVAPGDTIYVYRVQQKYVAVGALGSSGQTSGLTGLYAFDHERLSLNEALAKAGGLQDTRANPAQVFLYRQERRDTLEKMGVDLKAFAPDQHLIPTVYRANFRDPSSFFAAQKFPMRNKDVIYAANADAIEIAKFLGLVKLVTSTTSGVAIDAATTRDVLQGAKVLTNGSTSIGIR